MPPQPRHGTAQRDSAASRQGMKLQQGCMHTHVAHRQPALRVRCWQQRQQQHAGRRREAVRPHAWCARKQNLHSNRGHVHVRAGCVQGVRRWTAVIQGAHHSCRAPVAMACCSLGGAWLQLQLRRQQPAPSPPGCSAAARPGAPGSLQWSLLKSVGRAWCFGGAAEHSPVPTSAAASQPISACACCFYCAHDLLGRGPSGRAYHRTRWGLSSTRVRAGKFGSLPNSQFGKSPLVRRLPTRLPTLTTCPAAPAHAHVLKRLQQWPRVA